MPTRALSTPSLPTPANDCTSRQSAVETGLSTHDLARLVAELAPLATVDEVGGLRSVHRDPRLHPAIHGTAPLEETALERAVDAGLVRRARIARRRLAAMDPGPRRVALWLSERAHAAPVDVHAWAYEYGRTEGPVEAREREADLSARCERVELHLDGLRERARDKLDAALAREIDETRVAAESLRAAADGLVDGLVAWGRAAFGLAHSQWLSRDR